MLGGAWLFISICLLLASIVLRQAPLLLVAALFFLASGIARLWSHFALQRLEYSRHLSSNRVFFGETIFLETRLANRKMLPLPWVQIEDEVPDAVEFSKGNLSASYKPSRQVLSEFLSLTWYHRITRRYPIRCLKRGYFPFGPASIRSGDLFGFFQKEVEEEKPDYLMVYPRILPLESLGIPSRRPFGDLSIRRHLFQDPVRATGIRDYVPGDPLRHIHWKATARLQRMQSRVFEHTTTVDLALFLDARTEEPPLWGRSEQLLETAAIAVASMASYAIREGYSIGLYVNEPYSLTGRMIKLPPSGNQSQLLHVLEALAQIQGWPLVTMQQLLNREAPNLPWSTTVTVVTAVPTPALLASLRRFRAAGRRMALVIIGERGADVRLEGIPVYRVSDEVYWRELHSVNLKRREVA